MPEPITPDLIQEVYILDSVGIRRRVYRGSKQDQIAWKVEHHSNADPRVITPDPARVSQLAAWPGDQ